MGNPESCPVLCRNIVYLRTKYHLSRKALAALLGIGTQSLRRMEAGELPQRVGCFILRRMADVFGVSVDELLGSDLAREAPKAYSAP